MLLLQLFLFLFLFWDLNFFFNIVKSYFHMQLFWEGQKQPPEVFYKKVVLKSLANFTEKQLGLQLY